MLITNATIISFRIPDEMEQEKNFKNATEDIQNWVKSETSQFITYKKIVRYSIEGGIVKNE